MDVITPYLSALRVSEKKSQTEEITQPSETVSEFHFIPLLYVDIYRMRRCRWCPIEWWTFRWHLSLSQIECIAGSAIALGANNENIPIKRNNSKYRYNWRTGASSKTRSKQYNDIQIEQQSCSANAVDWTYCRHTCAAKDYDRAKLFRPVSMQIGKRHAECMGARF